MSVVAVPKQTDITARLNNLKVQIEKGKTEKTRAEAGLENYTKQREEIIREIRELGVEPKNLEAEIDRLTKENEEALGRAEELLRG